MIRNFTGFFITQMLIVIGMVLSVQMWGKEVLSVGIVMMVVTYGIYAITEAVTGWKEDK